MKKSLENKRALVCGSTDGIGRSTAILMAKEGCEVILAARNEEKLKSTLKKLSTPNNQNHSFLCADFNKTDLLKSQLGLFLKKLNKPIHILINNSGGPGGGLLIEAKEEDFKLAFDRLLIANQIITQAVVKSMINEGYGRIINIISTSVNQVLPGLGVSNTIRGSVSQWAKTLAIELGEDGITVNNILPGYTDTNRLKSLAVSKSKQLGIGVEEIRAQWESNTSLKRIGKPEEIANVILFLASEASSYVTGHNLSVDGGRFGV